MAMCFCVTEPDHGMEPGLAHHFFLQLISGMVSECGMVLRMGISIFPCFFAFLRGAI